MENVLCPLSASAHRTPNHIAIITEDRTWSYQDLEAQVQTLTLYLKNSGVHEKERIAFVASNSLSTVILFFSLFRLNIIACPLSHRIPQEQITNHLNRLKATHFVEPPLLPFSSTYKKTAPASLSLNSLATFLFTSGTSGTPKIACHTIRNHYFSALSSIPALKLEASSRWLLSLPLFHVGGIAILFRCFLKGATIVLSEKAISHCISHFNISHLSIVPTQLIRLVKGPLDSLSSSLKCVLLGGAPISTSLLKEAKDFYLPVYTTYGMTEMSSIITINGKILPHRQIKLGVDLEIKVRGNTLFQGYFDTQSETIFSPFDKEGWFATKDLGYFNSKGYLEILGRKDRQFISGGENIQPEEIEKVLCSIPGILRAHVTSKPDAEFGMRPIAYIEDETHSHTLETIRKSLQCLLPSFKHPVEILPLAIKDSQNNPNFQKA